MTDVTIETTTVHGAPTRYMQAGDPSAPTMVLLHDGAFGSDASSCWSGLLPLLAEDHHVLAPDLLGHGGTAKILRFDMDPMTQRLWHLQGFCEALGVQDAVFVGSSFGGGMILHAGVRRLLPMRAGVSICGPGGIFMVAERFADLQGYEPSEEAARTLCEYMERSPDDEEVQRRLQATLEPGHWECLAAVRVSNPGVEASSFDWRPKFREGLGTVEVPMLFVAGEDDVLLEDDWEVQLAELIPGARSVEVPKTRHLPHVDEPQVVHDAIADFLASL